MKRLTSMVLVCALAVSMLSGVTVYAAEPDTTSNPSDNLLRIWYDEPATNWQTEALAIGNGYMGGLVFGGIANDKIHLNEKTVWGGGPNSNSAYSSYKYGVTNNISTEAGLNQIKADLEAIREKLDDKSQFVFGFDEKSYSDSGTSTSGEAMNWLNKLMGDLGGYAAPVDYANIQLNFAKSGLTNSAASNYIRDLDMRTGLATVSYDYDGVHYTREYFNSYPDNVLVIRLEADRDGMLTFDASLAFAGSFSNKSITANDDTITMRGSVSNGLNTEAQLKVVNEGGEIAANDNGSISVADADAVTLILACGTDYKMELPTFRSGVDPHEAVSQRVQAAARKGYEAVKRDHVADHSELFSRLEISFNGDVPQIPTDELIKKYRNMVDGDGSNAPTESEQRALEVICYQFGRYLTIAGSREGALPTNLQGVWGEGGFAWGGDYHFNINVQMNYWPTMASNLGECLLPFNDYLEVLRLAGRDAAAAAFGIKSEEGEENGWLVGCFSTPYMFSALGQKNNAAGWNPTGSAWALLNAYEYYLYTGDVDYLREHLYPSMKEVANFWNEALWWSEAQQRYVSAPSYSPEHGPIVNGASYDQQFIWQHFENTIQAARILGVDEDLVKAWEDKQSKLDPVLVGDSGQVKEWFEETTFGKAKAGDLNEISIPRWQASLGAGEVAHRHLSHLMALYPGTLINKDNDEFMDAAKVSLNQRGLDATGWSKAHKLNLWARTGDGENCFKIVQSAVGGGNSGFLTNLFSSHGGGANYKAYPIFQIDGNFGYTAGVNEMLLQSQLGYTQFLPALPEAWSDGYVEGIVARGNFVINQYWSSGLADRFTITSRNGGEFVGEYKGLGGYTVKDSKGNVVAVKTLSSDKISFDTKKDETYVINFTTDPARLEAQIEQAEQLVDRMNDSYLISAKAILNAAIDEAQSIVDAGNSDAYYDTVQTLAAACRRAENALSLLDAISDAEEFYAENEEKSAIWSALNDVAQELYAEIQSAKALLADENAAGVDFVTQMSDLKGKQQKITALLSSISVKISTSGGILTMVPSSEEFEIRYTIDGNDPSLLSKVYEEPVELPEKNTNIRAVLYIDDVQMSKEFKLQWNGGVNLATKYDQLDFSSEGSFSSALGPAQNAVDGNLNTAWLISTPGETAWIELTYDEPVTFNHVYVNGKHSLSSQSYVRSLFVQCWDDDAEDWKTLAEKEDFYPDLETNFSFETQTASKIRLCIGSDRMLMGGISEFQISYRGETANLSELQNLVDKAAAMKNEAGYLNADEATREEFDYYLSEAEKIAENENSDQDTVDAAVVKMEEIIMSVGGMDDSEILESLVNQVEAAERMSAALSDRQVKKILDAAIESAQAVIDQGQSGKYYETLQKLRAAMDRVSPAVDLAKQITQAEAFRAENQAQAVERDAVRKALDALTVKINEAKALAADPDAVSKELNKAGTELKNAISAVNRTLSAVEVDVSVSKGVATMTVSDEQFEIRYTLDGSEPTLVSKLYDGAFEIPKESQTLKAAAFLNGVQVGDVVTKNVGSSGGGENLALNKKATSTTNSWGGYGPDKAVDGSVEETSRWAPYAGPVELVVDLEENYDICQVAVRQVEKYARITAFEIYVSEDGESWGEPVFSTDSVSVDAKYDFNVVNGRYVKLKITETKANSYDVSDQTNLNEFEVYGPEQAEPEPAVKDELDSAITSAEEVVNSDIYANANEKDQALYDACLEAARAVLENETADQNSVDAAVEALAQAAEMLANSKHPVEVNFDSAEGTRVESQMVYVNGYVLRPIAPERDGYIFDGWFVDEDGTEAFDFNTSITESITLYARWREISAGPDVPPVTERELVSIEITTPPTKTRYTAGERFDPAGMVVTARYSDGSSKEIPVAQCTFTPDGVLVEGNSAVLVTYSGFSATVTITTAARPTTGGSSGGGSSSGGSSTPPPVEVVDPETPLAGNAELNKDTHIAYISGYEDGTVRPKNNITREEVAAIFYQLLTDASKDVYGTNVNSFSDVSSSRWSNRAISTLANANIISGYPDGTFKPSQTITRAEFTAIAARFDTVTNVSNPFSDTVGHWAEKQISFAASKGWVKGYSDGTFKPGQPITRGEAITLTNNLLGRAVDANGLTEGVRQWADNEEGAWYYYNVLEATNSHDYVRREEGGIMENWTAVTQK